MSAPSPIAENTDLLSYEVKVNGSPIDSSYEVISIEIEKGAGRISSANITLADGDPATKNFPLSDSSTFIPGNNIDIALGYDAHNTIVFSGIIISQNIRSNSSLGTTLTIECMDKAAQMTLVKKNATWKNCTDSDIISKIIGNYGLKTDVQSTGTQLEQMVQYYATDMEFISERAKVNGLLVLINNNTITVKKPDTSTEPILTLTYGDDIMDMDLMMDALHQVAGTQSFAWDFINQSVTHADGSTSISTPGNISSNALAKAMGEPLTRLQSTAPITTDNLKDWANASFEQAQLAKATGTVTFQGSSLAEPGAVITLQSCGDRFNGNYYVSGVSHSVADGNWTTRAELGTPINEHDDNTSMGASGLLPAINGLANGKVKKIYEDPDGEYRVLVTIPLISENEGIWARLSNLYATNNAGAFFYPEVGDEVMLGFMNNDPRYPIILGSLYSSKNKPYTTLKPDEKNNRKGIVTKSGLQLIFDDEYKTTEISTPANNKVTLNDQDKTITIADQNSNVITMSAAGITIKSATNITLKADEKVNISGNMGVTIEASSGDAKISGMNISANANMSATVEGATSATLTSGAETTIKGAMVMIN